MPPARTRPAAASPRTLAQAVLCLRALGEDNRLRLFALLARGEWSVSELTQILGQSQPSISRHLRLLTEAGLVAAHREGHRIFYRRRAEASAWLLPLLPQQDAQLRQDAQRLQQIAAQRRTRARRYFDAHAQHWRRLRALHIPETRIEQEMAAWLGARRPHLLVDLGTGTGRMLQVFAPLARRALGVDISAAMLGLARAKLGAARLSHCTLRQASVTALPFPDNIADVVILHQVLHFLPNPLAALQEAARILAPRGLVLIADFARHDLAFLCRRHAHHWAGFTRREMDAWLKAAGLIGRRHKALPARHAKSARRLHVCLWAAEKPAGAAAAGAAP